jgi:tetratricopeptide (TPR) repeat protein
MKIFISYSHHPDDKAFFEGFRTALTCMQRRHPGVAPWFDKLIDVGDRWDEEINATLADAQVVAFLMSQNFIASNYIWNNELLPTQERARQKLCIIVPIIVSAIPNIEQFSFIKEFQGLPEGLKPVDQWPNRAEVWAKVAEAIERMARNKGLLKAPAPVCAPAQPPSPPPSDFKGRAKEIKQLTAALSRPGGAAAITGLKGLGGVGKTTLAKYVAALPEMQALYPGPPIVVDMQGMSTTPLTPAAALLEAARAVKPDTPATDDLNQAAALFHQALSGQRKLVLLDNAPGNARLQSALPPPGCGLIVTSRTPALLPQGVEVFELDVLPMPDAVALLRAAAGRKNVTEEQWRQVAQACGRLPLALRAAAAYLARYSKVTSVDDYLRMVRDPARRAKALTTPGGDDCYLSVLGLSVDRLTEDDAALAARWRQLAVFPGDFDRPAAAAVWACDEDAAHGDIEQLYDRALLQVDEETGRYKLHDLLRDVARHGLADNVFHPAALRHARHYVEVLREVEKLYLQGYDDELRGLSFYDREAHNISGAMDWATARGEQDIAAVQVVNELPCAGPYVLSLRQPPETRIDWLQPALAAAQRLKDRRRESIHLGNLGVAFFDKGDFDAAAACQETALNIAKELDDRTGKAYALVILGNIYERQRKFHAAIEKHEEAQQILRDLKDRRAEGMTLGNIANAWARLGEHNKALEYYRQHLDIAVETGERRSESAARWNMSNTYATLGRMKEAIAEAERSLKISEEIGVPFTPTVRAALAEWRAAAAKAKD